MMEKQESNRRQTLRQILNVPLSGGILFGLVALAETLFLGDLSVQETLGALALFVVAGLIATLVLRLLTPLSGWVDRALDPPRLLAIPFLVLCAVFPLFVLILTRTTWTYPFLLVTLALATTLAVFFFLIWKHMRLKALWLWAAPLSTWLYYQIVIEEALLTRAGEELLDLPTLVMFLVAGGSAAFAALIARFGQSLAGDSPTRLEAVFMLGSGLALGGAAPEVIWAHYEEIFQIAVLFAFIATLHGLSGLRVSLPIKASAPALAILLLVGFVLLVPVSGKAKVLQVVHSSLAQKNRTAEILLEHSGLGDSDNLARTCELHQMTLDRENKFSKPFRASIKTAQRRPDADERTADPQRKIVDAGRPWNIVLITVDSLRYDRTSYSGLTDEKQTPTLAKLATQSQRFHRAYPQGAWTSLSVPALLWSLYPSKINYAPLYEDRKLRLYLKEELTDDVQIRMVFQTPVTEERPNIATVYNQSGYDTVAVVNDGSTGFFDPRIGMTKGFSEVLYAGADGHDAKAVDMASAALAEPRDKPLFMWVHLFDVHKCYQKPANKTRAAKWKKYEHRVKVADRNIGALLTKLDKLGLAERTIVIVTGDHGESFGELGVKGHGLALNEGTIHVPLLIRIPGVDAADYHRPVALVDLAPTLIDLAGAGEHVPASWVGTSLAPMLAAGRDLDHPPVYTENWRNRRKGKHKHLHRIGVIYGEEKAVFKFKDRSLNFYDISSPDAAKERLTDSSPHPLEMTPRQFDMAKFMFDRNRGLMKRLCK
jgi:arylsulfatase A-like enzyme